MSAREATIGASGRSSACRIPARIASSMSWLTYAMRSATRMICPSIVLERSSGAMPTGAPDFPFECFAMPSRTSQLRFRPRPVVLEVIDDAQALLVVVESARHQRVDDTLAGVAERRVPEVVTERDGLGQLLVQPEHLRDGARNLRDLERVREPGAIVIAGRREEDLRLVLEAAKRLAVDDAVAIALKRRPHVVFDFRRGGVPSSRPPSPPAARGSRARALRAVPGWSSGDDLTKEAGAVRKRAQRRSSPRASDRDRQMSCGFRCPRCRARACRTTSTGTYSRA